MWGRSSIGRALQWHCRGQGFDSPRLHQSVGFNMQFFLSTKCLGSGSKLSRSIKLPLLATLLFFLATFTCYAASTAARTTAGLSPSAQVVDNNYANSSDPSSIEHDQLAIYHLPIEGFNLVYTTGKVSLVDTMQKKVAAFKELLAKYSIVPENIVVIYTDYFDYQPVEEDPAVARPPQVQDKQPEEDLPIKNEDGVKINKALGLKKYPNAFLLAKRNVLIGTLVPAYRVLLLPPEERDLHVVKFEIPAAKGFLYHSNDFYKKLAVIKQSYNAKDTNGRNADLSAGDKNSTVPLLTPQLLVNKYPPEELIKQRVAILKYINMSRFKVQPMIGFMEYHELKFNTYSYFALPGDLAKLLSTPVEGLPENQEEE